MNPHQHTCHVQAVLDPSTKAGARAWLKCKVQDGPEMVVAALREGATEMQSLDLVFDQYTEFSVQGTASVHLTGERSSGQCIRAVGWREGWKKIGPSGS